MCTLCSGLTLFSSGFRCSLGPAGPCGGSLAGKIIESQERSSYSTFMFSGLLFGGFFGHLFSGIVISAVSHNGSYFALSIMGFAWVAVWLTMVRSVPYERVQDASRQSMELFLTPWHQMLRSKPYVALLITSLGYGKRIEFHAVTLLMFVTSLISLLRKI